MADPSETPSSTEGVFELPSASPGPVVLGPRLVLAAMMGAYLLVFGWLTWLQQADYATFDYDMGVFDQEIWQAAHHLNPFMSIRGLDLWANHVNPSIYLLVPFYWLGAGPHFLFLVQVIVFTAAAVPLWLLARDRVGNDWLALGIPFAWLMYPAVEWMTAWSFHPEYMAVPCLIFAYWCADTGRWRWYVVFLLVALGSKEDVALPVIVLGIVLALRGHRRAGVLTAVGALSWFALCVEAIMPLATGSSQPFYGSQFSELGNSIPGIVWNSVRHPSRLANVIFNKGSYTYYTQLMVPVAGMALLSPVVLLIAVPTLLVNVANNQGYPHQIKYQYGAYIAVGIFLAVVESLRRFRRPGIRRFQVAAICACALASNVVWSPSPLDNATYHSGYWSLQQTPHSIAMDQAVHMVPASAGVAATYNIVPHVSHRDQLYTWPNPWIRSYYGSSETKPALHPNKVDYLVLDTTIVNAPQQTFLLARLLGSTHGFVVVYRHEGVLVARRASG